MFRKENLAIVKSIEKSSNISRAKAYTIIITNIVYFGLAGAYGYGLYYLIFEFSDFLKNDVNIII